VAQVEEGNRAKVKEHWLSNINLHSTGSYEDSGWDKGTQLSSGKNSFALGKSLLVDWGKISIFALCLFTRKQ
jgi:hypothetical protein